MKLRDKLKLIALLMFIESISQALKHPILLHIDIFESVSSSFAGMVTTYYENFDFWVQLVLYTLFALCINQLDSKFPHAHFGRYFRLDLYVAILNAIAMAVSYSSIVISYAAKITTECAGIVTTFLAGYAIYNYLPTPAMKKVRLSYIILSLRHIVYAIILTYQLISIGLGEINIENISNSTLMTITWILLVPPFIISRALLYTGVSHIKTNTNKPHKRLKEV